MHSRKSFGNLQALEQGDFGGSTSELQGGGPLSHTAAAAQKGSRTSMDEENARRVQRCGYRSAQTAAISPVSGPYPDTPAPHPTPQAGFRVQPPAA
jgi:hypothetical protein